MPDFPDRSKHPRAPRSGSMRQRARDSSGTSSSTRASRVVVGAADLLV